MAIKNSDTISWDAVTGAVDYQVVAVDSNGNANPPFNSPALSSFMTGGPTSAKVFDVFDGLAGGPYRIQVKAKAADPANDGPYSAPLNVDYDPMLDAPTNVIVT